MRHAAVPNSGWDPADQDPADQDPADQDPAGVPANVNLVYHQCPGCGSRLRARARGPAVGIGWALLLDLASHRQYEFEPVDMEHLDRQMALIREAIAWLQDWQRTITRAGEGAPWGPSRPARPPAEG